jgi:hypothetical protein
VVVLVGIGIGIAFGIETAISRHFDIDVDSDTDSDSGISRYHLCFRSSLSWAPGAHPVTHENGIYSRFSTPIPNPCYRCSIS